MRFGRYYSILLLISILMQMFFFVASSDQALYEDCQFQEIFLNSLSNFVLLNKSFKDSYVHIINCSNFVIANCTFVNTTLRIEIKPGQVCRNFTIEGNFFVNGSLLILFGCVEMHGISNFTIKNNLLLKSVKIGVAFADDGVIRNNTILNSDHGIATRNVLNLSIEGNIIKNCSGYGIYLGTQLGDPGTFNVTISNNFLVRNNIGIARYYGSNPISNVQVENNTFLNSSSFDIKADFPAIFAHNTVTSRWKIEVVEETTSFIGNVDLNGTPVQPCDVNFDLRVDMKDLGVICKALGITSEPGNRNEIYDIVHNGKVDMKDIGYVCKHYFVI